MISLFDTYSLERALSLPTDPKLRQLIGQHVTHLNAADPHVRETTYFLIVDAGSSIEEVTDELGWSPLIDLDGNAFGDEAYCPFHEDLADQGGWFVMMVTAGNDAMFVVLIRDADGVPPELLSLCHSYAREAQ